MRKLNIILLLIVFSLPITQIKSQEVDTIEVFFEINNSILDKMNLEKIDMLFDNYEIEDVKIFAYSDFLGTVEHNQIVSNNRSEYVKSILIGKGFSQSEIKECHGLGIHPASDESFRFDKFDRGIARHRKVQIVFTYAEEEIEIVEAVDSPEKNIEVEVEEPVTIPIFKNLDTENLEVGENIVLENILFHGGTPEFKIQSESALGQLFLVMQKNPDLVIEIQGHICCEKGGKDGWDRLSQNDRLSENRAKAVYDYLVKGGIEEDRMTYVGFASTKKLYPEERSAFEEDQNRRVEIMIIEK
jgi:outer membrane protein OmpA-like peptidoglycan-associated protein